MPDLDLLFVYGTLRRSALGGMHRLMGRVQSVGEAVWHGHLYLVDGYPGAVASADGSLVRGELYRLTEPSRSLAALDRYEECGPEFGEASEYLRTVTTVTLWDGTETESWIYLYNRPVKGLVRIESGDYCITSLGE